MRRLDWEGSRTVPPELAAWANDPGLTPLSLLGLMRRFAKIDPAKLTKIQAREIDPQALKRAWIEMSDEADAKITHLADTLPDTSIGVPLWMPQASPAGSATTPRLGGGGVIATRKM